jgi:hypothetical protein
MPDEQALGAASQAPGAASQALGVASQGSAAPGPSYYQAPGASSYQAPGASSYQALGASYYQALGSSDAWQAPGARGISGYFNAGANASAGRDASVPPIPGLGTSACVSEDK